MTPQLQQWTRVSEALLRHGCDDEKSRLRRVLADPEMATFWPCADEAFLSNPRANPVNLDPFRAHVLLMIRCLGGSLPSNRRAEILKRRRRLAKRVRRLTQELELEIPGFRSGTREDTYRRRRGEEFSGHADALDALARDLEDGAELGLFDPLMPLPDLVPQSGRQFAQRTLLERQLCECFIAWTAAPNYTLVAQAVRSAMCLTDLDPSDVGARWRSFLAQKRG